MADKPIVHAEDIELKRAEFPSRENEFRLLAEALPQIVWITRADGSLSTEATDAFRLAELPLPGAKPPLLERRRASEIRRFLPSPAGSKPVISTSKYEAS